jgi:hypothetical protein
MVKRATRAEKTRTERRKKPGQMAYGGGRLSVDEAAMDRDNFEYRFVSDRAGRAKKLYEQDWDPVNDPAVKPEASTQGTVVGVHGGTEENGQPYKQILMRKRKDWYEDDQKEKMAPLDELEDQIKAGQPQDAKGVDKDLASHSYIPGGGNAIEVTQGAKKA